MESKQLGNDCFKNQRFEEAIGHYSDAILSLESNPDTQQTLSIIFTNRSNARYSMKDFQGSLVDAEVAIKYNDKWGKAYFRKATALVALDRVEDAIEIYEEALKKTNDAHLFKGLLRKLKSPTVFPTLYPEQASKENTIFVTGQKKLDQLLDKLKEGGLLDADTLFNGLFSRLLSPESFRQVVYRSSQQLPHDSYLPASFQELLGNPLYYNALIALFPKIKAKSESVLANVKSKAATQGQFMDQETEDMLKPQVLNEAFAHQVVDMIHDINRRQNALLSETEELLADPSCCVSLQLQDHHISDISNDQIGFTVVDNFLGGSEWRELLCEECVELKQAGRFNDLLQKGDLGNGSTCWLTPSECLEKYPAFNELIAKIHSLPYELNSKIPDLKLRKPMSNCILLVAIGNISNSSELFPPFQGHSPRLDGSFGQSNNGYKVSATYHFWSTPNPSTSDCQLVLSGEASPSTHIDSTNDRLVLWRSRMISNQVTPSRSCADIHYVMTVFFHGPEFKNKW